MSFIRNLSPRIQVVIGIVLVAIIWTAMWLIVRPAPEGSMVVHSTDNSAVKLTQAPLDLTGTWKTAEGKKPQMTAEITSGYISIQIINDNDRVSYWQGSFANPKVNGAGITSVGDKTKLYWSTADEKGFVYRDDEITFDLSFMGVTSFVILSRG